MSAPVLGREIEADIHQGCGGRWEFVVMEDTSEIYYHDAWEGQGTFVYVCRRCGAEKRE